MATLVKNVRLIDSQGERGPVDVWISKTLSFSGQADDVIEAEGLYLAPGFVDLHSHLREPGQEEKEDLASGLLAAARGGYVAVVAMPNTVPVLDRPEALLALAARASALPGARLWLAAALSQGQAGQNLAELELLSRAGAVLFTDDGKTNPSSALLARGLRYARATGRKVAVHAEDESLRGDGVMNEGPVSDRLGLPGNPAAAEAARIARDLEILRYAGGSLHIQHLSTARGLELVTEAIAAGLNVSAEATPHHLILTDQALDSFDPIFKVAPPLRSEPDRLAIVRGLREGIIAAVATDHAPHTRAEKDQDLLRAPFGITGLEVAFPLLFTLLPEFPLKTLIERFTDGPRRILGLPPLHLQEGAPADLVLFDPQNERAVDPSNFASKAKFSPYAGWQLKGWPVATWVGGERVFYAR